MIGFDKFIDQPWFNHFKLGYVGDMTFLGSTYPAELMRHYYKDSDKKGDEYAKIAVKHVEEVCKKNEEQLYSIIEIYLKQLHVVLKDKSDIQNHHLKFFFMGGITTGPSKEDPFYYVLLQLVLKEDNQLHEVVCKFVLMQDPDYYLEIHIVEGKITNYKTRYVYEDF